MATLRMMYCSIVMDGYSASFKMPQNVLRDAIAKYEEWAETDPYYRCYFCEHFRCINCPFAKVDCNVLKTVITEDTMHNRIKYVRIAEWLRTWHFRNGSQPFLREGEK